MQNEVNTVQATGTSPTGATNAAQPAPHARWYAGVTGYQWLILAVASAGWIFDAFEGQVFNITRNQLLTDLLHCSATDPAVKHYATCS